LMRGPVMEYAAAFLFSAESIRLHALS
jgi:hypothetical protein